MQTKNNTLGSLFNSTFRKIYRLFVLLFKNGNEDLTRTSFDEYYMSLVGIKDFNALINNKPLFDQSVKNNQGKQDLWRQINTIIAQQINFAGYLEDDGAAMFFIAEKHQKTFLNISLDSLIVLEKYK